MIIDKGLINRTELTKVVDEFNKALYKIVTPLGKVSISVKIDPLNIKQVVNAVADDFENDQYKNVSMVESTSFSIKFDPIQYRLEYISGAWDELTSKNLAGGYATFLGIPSLDAVLKFKQVLSKEIDEIVKELNIVKKNSIMVTSEIDVNIPENGNYGNNSFNSQELMVNPILIFTQL